MRYIPVLQIGVGKVGQTLIDQLLSFNTRLGGRYGFRFNYIALADRRSAIIADERIPPAVLLQAAATKRAGGALDDLPEGGPLNDWRNLLTPLPCIVVDVTAEAGMERGLVDAVAQGHRVVLANKKPLCASLDLFQALTQHQRARYEATVGAGLPIISTLRALLDTGDLIQRIEGSFSGTLGFVLSQMQQAQPFSQAVREAGRRGWLEPDPRDDLSGMDVARKALILARTSGFAFELDDVAVERLYPDSFADLPPEAFVEHLPDLDSIYHQRAEQAADAGKTLRYIAQVGPDQLSVGLKAVALDSALGTLHGPDNLVVYQTQRYAEQALKVAGPGAGLELTASAVLSDMLAFAREWS